MIVGGWVMGWRPRGSSLIRPSRSAPVNSIICEQLQLVYKLVLVQTDDYDFAVNLPDCDCKQATDSTTPIGFMIPLFFIYSHS